MSLTRWSKPIKERFEEKYVPEPNSGCWLWVGATTDRGYASLRFNGKATGAHRVSWMLHRGPIPKGLYVLHKCDTPSCVNPAHLFLGTQKDNYYDMMKKGRYVCSERRGEGLGNAKLTNNQVETIRLLLLFGYKHKTIAKKYNISEASISAINTGRTWCV